MHCLQALDATRLCGLLWMEIVSVTELTRGRRPTAGSVGYQIVSIVKLILPLFYSCADYVLVDTWKIRINSSAVFMSVVLTVTLMPVGMWRTRTADSVLLTCWPPAPWLRIVVIFKTEGDRIIPVSMSQSSSKYGETRMLATNQGYCMSGKIEIIYQKKYDVHLPCRTGNSLQDGVHRSHIARNRRHVVPQQVTSSILHRQCRLGFLQQL